MQKELDELKQELFAEVPTATNQLSNPMRLKMVKGI